MAKKLSDRAIEILCAIKDRCEPGSSGHYLDGSFWVPVGNGCGGDDWSDDLHKHINISGAGDCRILVSLAERGLIVRPKTTLPQPYIYRITEDGVAAIEEARESGRLESLMANEWRMNGESSLRIRSGFHAGGGNG